MDRSMPHLDGAGAAAALRALGFTGAIIGVSGDVMAAERRTFEAAGLTSFLAKPVGRKQLVDAIVATVSAGGGGAGGSGSGGAGGAAASDAATDSGGGDR